MSFMLQFSNNASSTLALALSSTATTIQLAPGTGVLFPQIGTGQAFYSTITDAATETLTEIVLITAISGDTLTAQRAQQGTVAQNWQSGDYFSQNVTMGDMASFYQNPYPFSNFSAFFSNWLDNLPPAPPVTGWWNNGGVPTLAGPVVTAVDPFSIFFSNWLLLQPNAPGAIGTWWNNGGVPTLVID